MDLDDITTTKINNHFGNVFPHVMYCGCPSTGFVRFSLRRSKLGEGLEVNHYFAAIVTINYGTKSEKKILLPFQYGYGEQYVQEAMATLIDQKFIKDAVKYQSGGNEPLWSYCERKNIILRRVKYENCKKAELKNLSL